MPSTIHPFYKRWIKHLLVNEWVKWMKERIFKERQMSGVRWSPTDATLIDGQVHAGKIHESAWEIVDFSLGVTIFMCNSLIRKKKRTHLTSPSFLIPCFISTALLGEKLLKTAITIFPTSVVHLSHFNEYFVSSTQQDLLLSLSLIVCLFQTQYPIHLT